MPSSTVYLPNGISLSITPVFGGIAFKVNELAISASVIPPGWTIVIQTERPGPTPQHDRPSASHSRCSSATHSGETSPSRSASGTPKKDVFGRFTKPTLDSDNIFISSISLPSSKNFKPATSQTRQIAMLLYSTLWWYFHLPPPPPHISTQESQLTPDLAKPKGEWRVYIRREGIFKGRHLMQKLERMGLVRTEDSYVGCETADSRDPPGWNRMFISRRTFWQIDPRIFLFKLSRRSTTTHTAEFPGSPGFSPTHSPSEAAGSAGSSGAASPTDSVSYSIPPKHSNQFTSGSNLPTYFPPPPSEFTFTDGIRHPIRQKPPRQGEIFYIRYIPSLGQTLSFRVPYMPAKTTYNLGSLQNIMYHKKSRSATELPSCGTRFPADNPSDLELLHRWMNNPRVSKAWGVPGPQPVQEKFLLDQFNSRHSFPVFGCWDGRPFGYFEIYWVKEDALGRLIHGPVGNYDRGLHCLVGEEEFRGPHRVPVWLSSLVHYCWMVDSRTENILMEPRVDNKKFISYLHDVGFCKEGEVTFPHKQSALMRIRRENWEAPIL
ncbi:hypothetical protein AJ79_01371 [Helicocarpus griseus UAMH5409]|uniref:Acyltransferase MbtK/IucB-like conserved domain-containing protein n=1 Tax=Helicocarpus griseus UAMH5409 TaxID=1447875 RepID=A0A2B7Y8P7_9EURO|nr:hypothetical protein AJ79_01371 [Helicocarpus griseus UAMH5409]